jgi:hypothetical protein
MKKSLAAVALLVMAFPVAAPAKSAYAACLEAEQLLRGGSPLLQRTRTFGAYIPSYYIPPSAGYYSGSTGYAAAFPSSGPSFSMSVASWGEHERVSALVRACRHLRQVQRPAFRVTGLKSPALRTSANEPSGAAAEERPAR